MTIELNTKELDVMWNFLEAAFVKKQYVLNMSSVQKKLLLHLEDAYEKFHPRYLDNLYNFFFSAHKNGFYTRTDLNILITDRRAHTLSESEMKIVKRFLNGENVDDMIIRPIFLAEYVGKDNIEEAINALI